MKQSEGDEDEEGEGESGNLKIHQQLTITNYNGS
jgi:hypothetical protein